MPNTIPGTVKLSVVEDDSLGLTAALAESPTESGGIGGWEEVPRPGRRPLTVWRGPDEALRVALPLLFDRFAMGDDGESVEFECTRLYTLAGFDVGSVPGRREPPVLVMAGAGIPHARPANRWVVDTIEWGESIRRPSDGHRIRQAVTVTVMQHAGDDRLERVKASGAAPVSRTVRSTDNHDTFEKIAKWKLGSKRFGTRLARLNGKRSGDAKLKRGTKVRLPDTKTLAAWKRG